MSEEIQANLILEILGRPPERISEALNALVEKLGSEKGVKILEKTFHEPIQVEGSTNLFTSFAEVTAEFKEIGNLLGILFAYMPSHVEVIKPEKLSFSNAELNDIANKLIQRLHGYDAIAKTMLNEKEFILQKLKEAAPEVHKEITTPPPGHPDAQQKEN